jgi:tRNA (cytidine/uridine-2'-O-)-methyltransferase
MAVIREHDSLRECLNGVASVYYLSAKSSKPYWGAGFSPGDYLVFGRETKGLPECLLSANPERALTIPMEEDRARSLNLATSVAIVLYEAIRQNRGGIGVNRPAPV